MPTYSDRNFELISKVSKGSFLKSKEKYLILKGLKERFIESKSDMVEINP